MLGRLLLRLEQVIPQGGWLTNREVRLARFPLSLYLKPN